MTSGASPAAGICAIAADNNIPKTTDNSITSNRNRRAWHPNPNWTEHTDFDLISDVSVMQWVVASPLCNSRRSAARANVRSTVATAGEFLHSEGIAGLVNIGSHRFIFVSHYLAGNINR